jgi:V/A-type H+-transporting ATPase subunit I
MAIVKMKKFNLLALESQKENLIQSLHKFEGVEFINLSESETKYLDFLDKDFDEEKLYKLEGDRAKITFVLDLLDNYVEKEKGLKSLFNDKKVLNYNELEKLGKDINWESIYNEIKGIDSKLNSLKNELQKPKLEIDNLKPWLNLDIDFSDLDKLSSCSYVLGSIKRNNKDKFREEFDSEVNLSYVEIINESANEIKLFILFHKEYKNKVEDLLKKYEFDKVQFNYQKSPKKTIELLKEKINKIEKTIEELESNIKNYVDKIEDIKLSYEYIQLQIDRTYATKNFLNTGRVIVIEGWVPQESIEDLEKCLNDFENLYYIEFTEPSENDNVPILLKNNDLVKSFEAITTMYSYPKYNEIDPTPALVPFYMLFFGMMLSDAGYGLIMLIFTYLILKFVPLEEDKKSFVKMFFYLSFPTILVGALFGSYFTGAIKIPPIWQDPTKNVTGLLIVSIIIGIIQLYVGLGIKAYQLIKEKKYLDALYDVGLWYITLTSAILFILAKFAKVPSIVNIQNPIKYLMFAGMIGLVLTQGRENKSILGKFGGGIYGLYGITGYIGDIVSYSRLMALGLATSFIGSAINLMTGLLGKGILLWLFGPIIFIIGHLFNLFINALGSYVHSSRLQYLEYFGKFYEGGGKGFVPFKARNKFFKIKNK